MADAFGHFRSLEFLQRDNELVFGAPENRRRFLDVACSLASPLYYRSLRFYTRALKQRNEQIRMDLEQGRDERGMWNETLAGYAVPLVEQRARMAASLSATANELLAASTGDRFAIELRADGHPEEGLTVETFRERLVRSRRAENVFRTTVVGPHRDAFTIGNRERNARTFSSQGEARMIALVLKIALLRLLEGDGASRPVLLFDDILLEIDPGNTDALLELVGPGYQLFFTSTRPPDSPYFAGLPDGYLRELGGRQAEGVT